MKRSEVHAGRIRRIALERLAEMHRSDFSDLLAQAEKEVLADLAAEERERRRRRAATDDAFVERVRRYQHSYYLAHRGAKRASVAQEGPAGEVPPTGPSCGGDDLPAAVSATA